MTEPELPVRVEQLGTDPGPTTPTFVLLHGFGASGFSWRHWAPRLADHGHVLVVDLKGFGRAPKPDDGAYSPVDQAALVQRLIEGHDLRRVTIVGHSLGGGVALLVAMGLHDRRADRLERLVIVAGAAYEQRLPPFVSLARWPRLSTALFRLVGARFVVAGALRAVVHDAATVTSDQIRGYADPLESSGAIRVLLTAARQIVPPDLNDLTRRYPEIAVPTLLLWGRHDRVVPLHVGQRLGKALPDARLHVLDACGHLPPEELPDESFAVLEAFLAETRGV